ncbi:MAG: hypothetical protein ACK559_09470, partial [bacterium]
MKWDQAFERNWIRIGVILISKLNCLKTNLFVIEDLLHTLNSHAKKTEHFRHFALYKNLIFPVTIILCLNSVKIPKKFQIEAPYRTIRRGGWGGGTTPLSSQHGRKY